jgi:hypothetical protein
VVLRAVVVTFAVGARNTVSLWSIVTMDTMLLVMPTTWAMVSPLVVASVKRMKCSARNIVGMDGSPPVVDVLQGILDRLSERRTMKLSLE